MQQTGGYPVQLNHPGVSELVADALTGNDHGADLVEVRTDADYSPPWDEELATGNQIIGTYGSDAHQVSVRTHPPTSSSRRRSTRYDLLHSLFEGRSFMAGNSFTRHVAFNLDNSTTTYPARYPLYVPATQSSAPVFLNVDHGLKTGQTVKWFSSRNGTDLVQVPDPNDPSKPPVMRCSCSSVSDPISGTDAGYDPTPGRTVPLGSAFTFVRAAVYDSAGSCTRIRSRSSSFGPLAGCPLG